MTAPADCPLIPYSKVRGACDLCGKQLVGRQKRWCSVKCSGWFRMQHSWTQARKAARKRDGYKCVRPDCPNPHLPIEVNHIVPVNGSGYAWGCKHHQTNLETLCRLHHRITTSEQKAARLLSRSNAE